MNEATQLAPLLREGVVVSPCATSLPGIILLAGRSATERFVEFFAAQIRNPNTRAAYTRAVGRFFHFVETSFRLGLAEIRLVHILVYLETLQHELAAPSVKQHLAATAGVD
jgi:hypothetical protein